MAYEVEKITDKIIRTLFNNGNPNRAILASARTAASITSPRAQAVWPMILANLEPKMLSRSGKPTRAQVAIYAAIRFYAVHQQAQTQSVYGPSFGETPEGLSLFDALAELRQNEETRTALDRRVQPLLGTTNVASVINSLGHLVAILKAKNKELKIDYARLAQDLYWFQAGYEQANRVRLVWGQQYFRVIQQTPNSEGKKTND